MTYKVSSGTLNLCSLTHSQLWLLREAVMDNHVIANVFSHYVKMILGCFDFRNISCKILTHLSGLVSSCVEKNDD